MFLVDKYSNESIIYHDNIVNKILDTFEMKINIFEDISNKSLYEFNTLINEFEFGIQRYSNFQHLIVHGQNGSGKELIVNKLLEKIFSKTSVELKEVEYTVSGYSNTKTKVMIKQSKHHIIIEPNSNGFDKYLIQEIIQDYAKSELLNIIKNRKTYKVVVINKIDNLSYYAQASLRRTMEKYSHSCKFILISDQLSKIIEPLRSRCLLIRIPLPSDEQIIETILNICNKENIEISLETLKDIVENSDNNVNHAIWLLEMYKYGIKYEKNWELVIDNIVDMILDPTLKTNKRLYSTIKNIREQFYTLFITNITTQTIIRKIMIKLLNRLNNLNLKQLVIEITSIFEQRLSQGTRHIIHMESYVIKLIQLFTTHNINDNSLDVIEI